MNKRSFLQSIMSLAALSLLRSTALADNKSPAGKIEKIRRSEAEWRKILSPAQFRILRDEGTEPAGSSSLNGEKRRGTYACAGCALPLFTSEMKYESGTGWPSFFSSIPGHLETKKDFKWILPRTEYHCARCEGHQGHLFDDGPKPTGQRWCNNGLALQFIPA